MKLEDLLIPFHIIVQEQRPFPIPFYLYLTDTSGSAVKQVTVGKNKNEYIHTLCPHDVHAFREDKMYIKLRGSK